MPNEIQIIWNRVEGALDQRGLARDRLLRPGATNVLFQQAEALLNVRLPEEVKRFYACHNGLEWKNNPDNFRHNPENIVNGWSIHSLDTLCSTWVRLFEVYFLSYWKKKNDLLVGEERFPSPERAIQPVFWHPCWLPFMFRRYSENFISYYQDYFIDLVPGPDGQYGQILFLQERREPDLESFLYRKEPDPSTIHKSVPQVVAPSLSVFFARFAEDLEAGRYRYDVATGMLWSRAGWEAASKRGDLNRYWKNRRSFFEEGHQPPLTREWDAL